jgi:hypothetical protein
MGSTSKNLRIIYKLKKNMCNFQNIDGLNIFNIGETNIIKLTLDKIICLPSRAQKLA